MVEEQEFKEVNLEIFSAFLMRDVNAKYEHGLEGLKGRFVAVVNAINTVVDQVIFLEE
jgi:hypothetical protein